MSHFTKLTTLLFLTVLSVYSFGQSIVINNTISTFPHTEMSVNSNPTNGGQSATGMNGSCNTLPCCSVLVYKVVLPLDGVLRMEMTNFTPLAGSMIAYRDTVTNGDPNSFSDLEYISSSPGNFCGFRDTLQLGRAYEGWDMTPYGQIPTILSGLTSVYDFNNPSFNSGYFPAGDYYVLFFNENQQTSQGVGGITDVTFEFAPNCPPGYSCSSLSTSSCETYTAPSGAVFTSSGKYQDTLIGQAQGGLDSLIYITLTINDNPMVTLSIDSVPSGGSSNGVLNANANGGASPYTYSWSTGAVFAENLIAFQSFESTVNDNWNYVADPVSYATETDSVIAGSEDIWAVIREFTGDIDTASNGVNFWGCQDLENSNGGRSTFHFLSFEPVDVSNRVGVKLTFDYYSDGYDSSDEIEYEVVFDNDTVWSSTGTSLGKNNDEWVTVLINVPDSVNFVRLQLRNDQNGSSDYAGWDNIRLTSVNSVISGLSSGNYSVTVSDANGCTGVSSVSLGGSTTVRDTVIETACDSFTWNQNGTNYNMSGFYEDTISAGSTDTIKVLDLTIKQSSSSTDVQTACGSYTWMQNGMTYTMTGMYNDTIMNAAGCDSIITLDLTINQPSSSTDVQTACGSYTWMQNGMTYTMTGMYNDTVMNTAGCDSVITLDLTINQPSSSTDVQTACGSYTWMQNGMTYTMTGMYNDTIMNAAGCDSIITLDLTINQPSSSTDVQTACGSYTWMQNGMTYTMTGMYNDTVMNAAGCDSVITLDLTINNTPTADAGPDQSICVGGAVSIGGTPTTTLPGATFLWDNAATLNNANNANPIATPTVTTTYTVTVTNANGCTNTDQVLVNVNPQPSADAGVNQTICKGQVVIIGGSPTGPAGATYLWDNTASLNDSTISNPTANPMTTTTYTVTVTNANGCTDVDQVMVTVNNSTSSTVNQTACGSYTWMQNGMTYTMTGMYNDTTMNAAGCDSIITLDLTIDTVDLSVSQIGFILSSNQSGASYQWIDCSNGNTAIPGATAQSYTATSNGDYAVEVTINNCLDTSACITVMGVGLNDAEGETSFDILVYPNPTNSELTIRNLTETNIAEIRVRNLSGQLISVTDGEIGSNHSLQLNGNKGVYFIEIIGTKGERKIVRVMKQ